MFLAYTDLDDPRFVHSSDTNILEDLVIDLALSRLLNDNLLAAVNQGPECGRLWLLRVIAVECKVHAGVREIRVTCSVGNPKLLDCGVLRNSPLAPP